MRYLVRNAVGSTGASCGDGYVAITDRSKDVIKSGGEWISSIELENIGAAHPDVDSSACPGVAVVAEPHPKWGERPLLVMRRRAGSALTERELLRWFEGRCAKWMIPDRAVFIDEPLPLQATGKVSKLDLRATHVAAS